MFEVFSEFGSLSQPDFCLRGGADDSKLGVLARISLRQQRLLNLSAGLIELLLVLKAFLPRFEDQVSFLARFVDTFQGTLLLANEHVDAVVHLLHVELYLGAGSPQLLNAGVGPIWHGNFGHSCN